MKKPTVVPEQSPKPRASVVTPSLVFGALSLAAWLLFGVIAPLGAGWVHLFLAGAVLLFIRRVVTGRGAW